MLDEPAQTCQYNLNVAHGREVLCGRPNYKHHGLCVFHSPNVGDKYYEFESAFIELLEEHQPGSYNYHFRGFHFPNVDLSERVFRRAVKFSNCVFSNSNFKKCTFYKNVRFINSVFLKTPSFTSASFATDVRFINCTFNQTANFSDCKFRRAHILNCQFGGSVQFNSSVFKGGTNFTDNIFNDDVWFIDCSFRGVVSFKRVDFKARVQFRGARFSDEIRFEDSTVGFLKNPPSAGMNLNNCVLESAHLRESSTLKDSSFRDSFILSLNLANKEIINCDFTGAVFKAVLTQGWLPDESTQRKTKYIYTDYETASEQNEEGEEVKVYRRIEESRVPAEGVFGEGEHENFTLADYLKEPLKWSFALSVPPQFRTAVLNYIQFFTVFMNITEGVEVEIRTRQEGSKIRVEFMTDSQATKELVQRRFDEYRDNTTKDFNSLVIRFNNRQATDVERELFMIRYESQVNNLKMELHYTQSLLKKEEEKNRLQEKYLSLLQQTSIFLKEPQRLLAVSYGTEPQLYKTPVYFLTADLKGYSSATQEDESLYPKIQSFLLAQTEKIEGEPGCELVKLEGDCVKVWFRDGIKLIRLARNLLHDFEGFKFENPTSIEGFRIILGYGIGHREQRGHRIDFSGDFIIDTVRVDQPMKKYLAEHQEDSNQIWCTESFCEQMKDKHQNLKFDRLPFMSLDKGYDKEVTLYRVKFV